MTETILEQFDAAATAFHTTVSGVKPAQLDDPTPCAEWSVRQLINHVTGGNHMFTGLVTGTAPTAAEDADDDPAAAFDASARTLREAFAAEGVMERTFQTPMGERPAQRLVTTRIVEMTLHGWDLAKATGQPFEVPQEVVDRCLSQLTAMLPAQREGLPFGDEQAAAADASALDRLAAFAGRAA